VTKIKKAGQQIIDASLCDNL